MLNLAETLKRVDRDLRLNYLPILSPTEVEQLCQLRIVTWDGNVMSKVARGKLVDMGLAVRWNGYQVITRDGMAVLETLGLVNKPLAIDGNIFRE